MDSEVGVVTELKGEYQLEEDLDYIQEDFFIFHLINYINYCSLLLMKSQNIQVDLNLVLTKLETI